MRSMKSKLKQKQFIFLISTVKNTGVLLSSFWIVFHSGFKHFPLFFYKVDFIKMLSGFLQRRKCQMSQ